MKSKHTERQRIYFSIQFFVITGCILIAFPALGEASVKVTESQRTTMAELQNLLTKAYTITTLKALPRRARYRKTVTRGSFTSSTYVDSVGAGTKIDSSGTVHYYAKLFGTTAPAKQHDVLQWIPADTNLKLVAITPATDYYELAFRTQTAQENYRNLSLSIRVAKSENSNCLSVAKLLSTVLNLGAPFERLTQLQMEYDEIKSKIEASWELLALSDTLAPSSPGDFSISINELLESAILNRKSLEELLLTTSPETDRLQVELAKLRAHESSISDRMTSAASTLLKLASQEPQVITDYTTLTTWANDIKAIANRIEGEQKTCLILGCSGWKDNGNHWQDLQIDATAIIDRANEASDCGSTQPLSLHQIENAIASEIPDELVARRIRTCGISFLLDSKLPQKLGPNEGYPLSTEAVNYAISYRSLTVNLKEKIVSLCADMLANI